MKSIQVLGPGCSKCKLLREYTERAASELGLDVPVEYVTDLERMMAAGIMMTPALVVDGVVKFAGHVPSVERIKQMLE